MNRRDALLTPAIDERNTIARVAAHRDYTSCNYEHGISAQRTLCREPRTRDPVLRITQTHHFRRQFLSLDGFSL